MYHDIMIYEEQTKRKWVPEYPRIPGTGRSSIRGTSAGYLAVSTEGTDLNWVDY